MPKIIIITTENKMFERALSSLDVDRPYPNDNPLSASQNAVGGYIETVPTDLLNREYTVLCNEEGKLEQLPINPTGCKLYGTERHGFPIYGNIVIAKIGFSNGEPDIVGLSEDDVESIMDDIWLMMGGLVERVLDPDNDARQ